MLETIGGIFFLIVKPEQINRWVDSLTRGELSQDRHDFIANHILKAAHQLTGGALIFAGLYLLAHGIVKLVLVIEVIRDHLWAYIALIVVTVLFAIYQIYRIALVKFSISLVLLTIIDLVIIYLTQKEYRRQLVWRAEREAN